MLLKRDEIRTLVGITAGFPALVGIGWWLWGAVVLIPALTLMFVSLMGIVLGSVRRLRGDIQESLRQTQSLLYLGANLSTPHPLPALGGAALFPDSAAMLVGLIKERRPKLLFELGSGVSTLVCAQALKELGAGRIVSLDHNEHYAGITRQNLKLHGLEEWAEVRFAPIESIPIDGQAWPWYATSQLATDEPIELLIVDGPPKGIGSLARFPAAPVLLSQLAPDCLIVMDDTNRREEREIVRRWSDLLTGFEMQELPFGKGATLFRRTATSGCERQSLRAVA